MIIRILCSQVSWLMEETLGPILYNTYSYIMCRWEIADNKPQVMCHKGTLLQNLTEMLKVMKLLDFLEEACLL